MQPGHRPGDDQSDQQAAQADDDKLQTSLPQGEAPRDRCRHGEAVDHQPGRIIDHTLALNHRHDAARQAELFGGCTGRHSVGGRDHGPQDKGDRPGQAGDEVGDNSNDVNFCP